MANYWDLPISNPLYKPYHKDIRLEQSTPDRDGEKHIVIVSCGYNTKEFARFYFDSVVSQNYRNFHILYIDDASTDGSADEIQALAQAYGFSEKLILYRNTQKRNALANLYFGIHLLKPEDIVVILDADDRFAHDNVLSIINQTYSDPTIWLTYGQYREFSSGDKGFSKPYQPDVAEKNMFRYEQLSPSHLRTFYAQLFHLIRVDDLMYRGEFFPMSYDQAIMYPIIEMGRYHYKFISEILMDYNDKNPLSDHKINRQLQKKCDLIIRARTCYREVTNLFIKKDMYECEIFV